MFSISKILKNAKFISLFALLAGTSNATFAAGHMEAGDRLVRLRAVQVMPSEKSNITPIGGKMEVDSHGVPEIDFSYFYCDNIAFEAFMLTSKHDLKLRNSTLGNISGGSFWLLPIYANIQYHYGDFELFKPYAGFGLGYNIVYNEKSGNLLNVKYKNHVGYDFQVGADMPILAENVYFNMDIKKLFFKTRGEYNSRTILANVKINPWIVGVGLGYKF